MSGTFHSHPPFWRLGFHCQETMSWGWWYLFFWTSVPVGTSAYGWTPKLEGLSLNDGASKRSPPCPSYLKRSPFPFFLGLIFCFWPYFSCLSVWVYISLWFLPHWLTGPLDFKIWEGWGIYHLDLYHSITQCLSPSKRSGNTCRVEGGIEEYMSISSLG